MKVEILGITQHYPFDGSPTENLVVLQLPSGDRIQLVAEEADIIKLTREFVGVPAEKPQAQVGDDVMAFIPVDPMAPAVASGVGYSPMRLADEPEEFGGITEAPEEAAPAPPPRARTVQANSMGYPIPPAGARDPGEVVGGDNEDEEGVGSI